LADEDLRATQAESRSPCGAWRAPQRAIPLAWRPRHAPHDTITLLDGNRRQHKVRLAGIDAPEKGQPFGQRSKQNLSDLVYRQEVLIEWDKVDRHGRIVGKIRTAGGTDACLEQIKAGMAWWFRKYAHEQSAADQRAYANAEQEARTAHRGLWADDLVVAPWDWRAGKRTPDGPLPLLPPEPSEQRAQPARGCDPAYPDVCIPSPPPDLDCGDVRFREFQVLPPDPHRFDRDRDGIGCEPNPNR